MRIRALVCEKNVGAGLFRSLATLLLLQPLRLALSLQIEVVPRLLQQPERGVGLGAVMPPVLVWMDQEGYSLKRVARRDVPAFRPHRPLLRRLELAYQRVLLRHALANLPRRDPQPERPRDILAKREQRVAELTVSAVPPALRLAARGSQHPIRGTRPVLGPAAGELDLDLLGDVREKLGAHDAPARVPAFFRIRSKLRRSSGTAEIQHAPVHRAVILPGLGLALGLGLLRRLGRSLRDHRGARENPGHLRLR
mmetsp:Transcript_9354/g.42426  ORF Transcript_9354/g.42426 Transcript_9354/m.42426 type:complete len:253 (-) Transcript_9354:420-1178(-)